MSPHLLGIQMSLGHRLLELGYPLIHFANSIQELTSKSIPRLRVLMYHDINPSDMKSLATHLLWLKESWDFLSPFQFEQVMQGHQRLLRNSLLLTFDDGFLSNLTVAVTILNPLRIKAIFFVIPDFIDKIEQDQSRKFIVERLRVDLESRAPLDHFKNMSWSDLSQLLENGHVIGAHSMSHESLGDGTPHNILGREIIEAADRLESKLGTQIRHFAFPFGNFNSLSKQAFEVAMSRYRFIYSGIRGDNIPGSALRMIRRDALKPTDKRSLVGALLLGGADFRYRRYTQVLDDWALNRTC